MRLEVTKRAQREAKRLAQWWLDYRDKALSFSNKTEHETATE
jgi:hypothetical protein